MKTLMKRKRLERKNLKDSEWMWSQQKQLWIIQVLLYRLSYDITIPDTYLLKTALYFLIFIL